MAWNTKTKNGKYMPWIALASGVVAFLFLTSAGKKIKDAVINMFKPKTA